MKPCSRYIVKRLLLMIPTLFGAAVLVFVLMRLIPGDICVLRLATGGGSSIRRCSQNCRAELGTRSADAGAVPRSSSRAWSPSTSASRCGPGRPIIDEIGLRFQLSLQVAIMATLTAILLAIPLGTISAVKQNTWIDYVVRAFSIAGVAMPSFWLGILIILGILITSKAWFGTPWMPPITYVPIWVDPVAQPEHADLAGARHRLPLFGGGHPHDALGHARGAARGLRAHRARQGRCSRS